MVLEGLYYGKPSLCLAYNDNNLNIFDWKINSKNQPHLKILHKYKIPSWCYQKKQLSNQFIKFANNLRNFKKNKILMKKIVNKSVYFGKDKYLDRLNKIIN